MFCLVLTNKLRVRGVTLVRQWGVGTVLFGSILLNGNVWFSVHIRLFLLPVCVTS